MTTPLDDGGNMMAVFTDPTGVDWYLTDTSPERGYFTTFGISGWGATTYEFSVDPEPRGGEDVRFIRSLPARITWPMHVWGETHLAFIENLREIKRAITSTVHRRAPGTLTVYRSTGMSSGRAIDVYYEEGFRGEGGVEDYLFANPVITFYAPDGYWRDITPTTVLRQYSPGVNFLNPFPSISSGQVIGATTVTNPGEVDAWPEWTVTGPMSSLTATNHTTGHEFILTYGLAAAEELTITTHHPTVRGPAGENLVNAINWPTAYLWPLMTGDNEVEFTVGGSGSGTAIELSFYPRYEGA